MSAPANFSGRSFTSNEVAVLTIPWTSPVATQSGYSQSGYMAHSETLVNIPNHVFTNDEIAARYPGIVFNAVRPPGPGRPDNVWAYVGYAIVDYIIVYVYTQLGWLLIWAQLEGWN
jgi:hypothetical protein